MDAVYVMTKRKAYKGMMTPMEASWKRTQMAVGM